MWSDIPFEGVIEARGAGAGAGAGATAVMFGGYRIQLQTVVDKSGKTVAEVYGIQNGSMGMHRGPRWGDDGMESKSEDETTQRWISRNADIKSRMDNVMSMNKRWA